METFEKLLNRALSEFKKKFNRDPVTAACAPGRVNLIGEHIDYCDGFVLPMALPMVTVIVGALNNTEETVNLITCSSDVTNSDESCKDVFKTRKLKPSVPKWSNYVKGVISCCGLDVPGFDAVIATNVPVGGGLSSSAALEVCTLTFIEEILKIKKISEKEKALICQKAEHTFAGMPCGIMDQFISVAGKKGHALLIDCKSLDIVQVPFESEKYGILICNSNVSHKLSDSEYPLRRKQCSEALELMALNTFRDATEANLLDLQNKKVDDVLLKRARHVITEIKRTKEAADALKNKHFEKMGELMTASHASLRDDFEVSCPEIDILVNSANSCNGVLGSRMTGGGFGGCTVTLVKKNYVDQVKEKMKLDFKEHFKNKNSKNIDFYMCEPSDGTRVLKI